MKEQDEKQKETNTKTKHKQTINGFVENIKARTRSILSSPKLRKDLHYFTTKLFRRK